MDLASIKKFFASLTLQKLVPVILIVVIGLLLVKLLLKLFDRVLERSRLERTMFSFLRSGAPCSIPSSCSWRQAPSAWTSRRSSPS